MLKRRAKLLWALLLMFGCKKPFTPTYSVSDNSKYLVIEGAINGSSDSTIIKLSRSKKIDTSRTITPETGASVLIENDGNGGSIALVETTAGTYATGPINLDNSRKYRLHIKTVGNKEYLSDFVPVKNAPPIDSVGFVAQAAGVQIYVNSHDAARLTRYYRWDYMEAWQFHSKYNSSYYGNNVDSVKPRLVSQQVYNCFGQDFSNNITIASTTKLTTDNVYNQPVTLVPGNSEKIETKYSILVKQYALTPDAYGFWDNLQKNTEKIGSIFDAQPSEAQGNYHSVSNPNEIVIGYLSAGNVSYKRIFITAQQLAQQNYVTQYPQDCELDTVFSNKPNTGIVPDLIHDSSPYRAVQALYLPPANPFGLPTAMTFSTTFCVDCTLRGTTAAPPFWQ